MTFARSRSFALVLGLSASAFACDPSPRYTPVSCDLTTICPGDTVCFDGLCREPGTFDSGNGDAGNTRDGSLLDGSRDSSVRDSIIVVSDSAVPDADTCASVSLTVQRTTPNVMVLVDRSSSMTEQFPAGSGITRWNAVKNALMAQPDGVIDSLQNSVRFGFATYHGYIESGAPTCPVMATVDPALQNFNAINASYPAAPVNGTPTGEAVEALLAQYRTQLAATGEPTILLLATDGEPFLCNSSVGTAGRARALSAVQAAFAADNIKTYILSVGTQTQTVLEHFQQLANAGIGRAPTATPAAPYWVATDPSGLVSAVNAIVGDVVPCTLELDGEIQASRACMGTVTLDGTALACNGANGWRAVDSNHIELLGNACENFRRTGGSVNASFPCEVIIQ